MWITLYQIGLEGILIRKDHWLTLPGVALEYTF